MKKMIMVLSLLTVLSVACATIDLGVIEILPGTIYYGTSAKVYPNIKIHNYGDELVNDFDVNVVIFDNAGDVYDFTKTVTDIALNAGEETFITMDDLWIVDDPDLIYAMTATVIIADDTNPDNDWLSNSFNIIQLDYSEEAYAIKYVMYADKTFGSLELDTGNYTQIAEVGLTFSNRARGADFAEGVMYGIYSYNSIREFHLMQPDGTNILLGEITSDNFVTNESISSFTYNYDNNKFYFSTSTLGVLEPKLYTLNPYTLEAEFIGQINNLQFMSIEYAEGAMYGIEVQQRNLWQIDMETGVGTEIGSFGLGWFILDQCLSYDRSSGTMYATFFLETSGGIFCTVNLETGNATQIQAYGYDDNMKFFAVNASLSSAENEIISFQIPEQTGETIFDNFNHTVLVSMPEGTNVTALIPVIETSEFATVFPESGTPQNFTDPVEYTVTAENGDEQIWMVAVSVLFSSENSIISFTVPEQVGETVIDITEYTVQLEVPDGTNVTALIPTIEISENATVSPENGTPQDFTDMVEYTVTAENGDEQIWTTTVTLLVSSDDHLTPLVTELKGNYPNPFNPETTISFSVAKTSSFVNLEIFNLKGQKVKTLVNEKLDAGIHQIIWNGKDENNKPVSSSMYFYKLQASNFSQTKKMILMK